MKKNINNTETLDVLYSSEYDMKYKLGYSAHSFEGTDLYNRLSIHTLTHRSKDFVQSIQTDFSPYYIGLPVLDTTEQMCKYFYKVALYDDFLYYMSDPLDKKKEFVVLVYGSHEFKGQATKKIKKVIKAFKKDNILNVLNIQAIGYIHVPFEIIPLMITHSINLLYALNAYRITRLIYSNLQNPVLQQNLDKIGEQENKKEGYTKLSRVKTKNILDILKGVI